MTEENKETQLEKAECSSKLQKPKNLFKVFITLNYFDSLYSNLDKEVTLWRFIEDRELSFKKKETFPEDDYDTFACSVIKRGLNFCISFDTDELSNEKYKEVVYVPAQNIKTICVKTHEVEVPADQMNPFRIKTS